MTTSSDDDPQGARSEAGARDDDPGARPGGQDPRDDRPGDDGTALDEDAVWRAIVDNYGDPVLGPAEEPPAPPPVAPPAAPSPAAQPRTPAPAREPGAPESWEDEGHFVPPEPPPVPLPGPRRLVAWAGLLGAPLLGLLLMLLGVHVGGWAVAFLVVAFLGGFGYLVATMRPRPSDPWSGDDGAVV